MPALIFIAPLGNYDHLAHNNNSYMITLCSYMHNEQYNLHMYCFDIDLLCAFGSVWIVRISDEFH